MNNIPSGVQTIRGVMGVCHLLVDPHGNAVLISADTAGRMLSQAGEQARAADPLSGLTGPQNRLAFSHNTTPDQLSSKTLPVMSNELEYAPLTLLSDPDSEM